MFWLGFGLGCFAGASFGALMLAVVTMAREPEPDDDRRLRAREAEPRSFPRN
jgi:hypothetical protein